MSESLDHTGRVAIVTGAGRGIGRAHALELARRGAAVLVNDLGRDAGAVEAAQAVVAEITAAGGSAAWDGADVGDPVAAGALVSHAVSEFGRLDAVVNNAGLVHNFSGILGQTATEVDDQFAVHVRGSFNVTRAAWPHLTESGSGRIVTTASTRALFGAANGFDYAAAKAGVIGLTRCFAVEGEPHGIKANTISPAAWTRMAAAAGTGTSSVLNDDNAGPAFVSPLIGLLCHPACPANGEVLTVGMGRVARIMIGVTQGIFDRDLTAESILERFDEVCAEPGYITPLRYQDEMELFFRDAQLA